MERVTRFLKDSTESISSVKNLCRALDITELELQDALNLGDDRYVVDYIPKSNGSLRTIHKPNYKIRRIQRRINNRIFSPKSGMPTITWPFFIFGSIPNQSIDGEDDKKDYIECVRHHCLAQSILKVDVKDFFNNIHEDHVSNIFSNFFNYPPKVASCLTNICCYKGFVVQGGLTSSYIASLCLFDVEPEVVTRIERKGLTYTRLVDDITVSSKERDYDFSFVKDLIVQMLHSKDLPVNLEKTVVIRSSAEPLIVHGLRVSYKEPRLPSTEISRIRAAVKNIEKLASEPKYRLTHAYRKDFNRCMGRVNKLHRVGHNQHRKLIERMMKVYPKASTKDVERLKISIARLERDYPLKKTEYWYFKRFHRAKERLNLIKRSFKNLSMHLKDRLKIIMPEYES